MLSNPYRPCARVITWRVALGQESDLAGARRRSTSPDLHGHDRKAARMNTMIAPIRTVEAAAETVMPELGRQARTAARVLAHAPAMQRDNALAAIAQAIRAHKAEILAANGDDLTAAHAAGVIGIIYESRPNVTADAAALCLKAGNAAILRGGSESQRSNLAIHAAIVEGLHPAIVEGLPAAMWEGLPAAGLPPASIGLVPTRDRAAVGMMLKGLDGTIDVI